MIQPIRKPKAKRVVKTQDFHDVNTKRAPSPRSALWGTWRTKHAKPSTPVTYSGTHYKPS